MCRCKMFVLLASIKFFHVCVTVCVWGGVSEQVSFQIVHSSGIFEACIQRTIKNPIVPQSFIDWGRRKSLPTKWGVVVSGAMGSKGSN